MRKCKIYCPVNAWDCAYYKDGECGLEKPLEDCEDFVVIWGKESRERDYTCYEEERTAFEC